MPIARLTAVLLMLTLLLAACAEQAPPTISAPTPTTGGPATAALVSNPTSVASPEASSPAASSATSVPPTRTAAPPTIAPQVEPVQPTNTPPIPEAVIDAGNAERLRLLRTTGYGMPYSAAIAPDAGIVAVGTDQGLALFSTPSGEHLRFERIEGGVHHLALSPDGQLLVVNGALRRLDQDTIIDTVEGINPRFSPDGRYLATIIEEQPPFDIADLEQLQTRIHTMDSAEEPLTVQGYAPAFSDTGLVAIAGPTGVRVLSLPGGRVQAEIKLSLDPATREYIKSVGISADGSTVTLVTPSMVEEWRVSDATRLSQQRIGDTGQIYVALHNVALSPRGDLLATAHQGPEGPLPALELRSVQKNLAPFESTSAPANGGGNHISFSAGGSAAVLWSMSPLMPPDTVRVLDLTTGAALDLLLPRLLAVEFSPDGLTMVGLSPTTLYFWDVVSGELRQSFSSGMATFDSARLRFSPDGMRLAAGGAEVILYGGPGDQFAIWDLTNNENIASGGGFMKRLLAFGPTEHALWESPEGVELARPGGEPLPLPYAPNSIIGAALSPDGQRLALALGGEVLLLETSGGEVVMTIPSPEHQQPVSLRFSPDGALLAASSSTTTIWNISGAEPATVTELPAAPAQDLVITLDNTLAFIANERDLIIYSLPDGSLAATIEDAGDASLEIGPSHRLLGVLRNGIIELWGVE